MGSRVSRSTGLTSANEMFQHSSIESTVYRVPRSVISAKVRLALRCRSTLSEYTSVLKARSGSPVKKSYSPRCLQCQPLD